MKLRKIFFSILILWNTIGITNIYSQIVQEKETSDYNPNLNLNILPIDLTFTLKTSHLWRGTDSSPSPLFCTDLSITDKNKMLRFGIWNGLGTNGTFKELNHYFNFTKSGFVFGLYDIYTFSTDAKHNNKEYFNYKAKETGRFLDAFVKYRLPGKLPFQFMWATLLFGRDRGELNEYNRYTTYVAVEYPIYQKEGLNVDLGIGGAFALRRGRDAAGKKTGAHFYGGSPGINDVSLKVTKDLIICKYNIPVSVYCMWNPEENHANVQVSFLLFSM